MPWFFLHKGGKAIEIVGPELRIAIEPVHRLLHRPCGEPARHRAAGLFARDETRIGEHVEMLHDRRQRHREWLRQLAHRQAFLVAEPRQQRATGGIGKRRKGAVQRLILILHHVV
ncbi:hypothetical protein J2R80_001124 [Bradyrhizobium sp. USDA 4541]|nr:hypothetical protein [Bradyrhizobium sp. USDA 4541]